MPSPALFFPSRERGKAFLCEVEAGAYGASCVGKEGRALWTGNLVEKTLEKGAEPCGRYRDCRKCGSENPPERAKVVI